MLVGKPVFEGENDLVVMSKQVETLVDTIPGQDRFPSGLSEIVLKARQNDPEKRQESMGEIKEKLRRCRDGELAGGFLKRSKRTKILLAALFALALFCITAFVIFSCRHSVNKTDPRRSFQ